MIILICQHQGCEWSSAEPHGELPRFCYGCKKRAYWRVAIDGEYTAFDRKVLKQSGIPPDP